MQILCSTDEQQAGRSVKHITDCSCACASMCTHNPQRYAHIIAFSTSGAPTLLDSEVSCTWCYLNSIWILWFLEKYCYLMHFPSSKQLQSALKTEAVLTLYLSQVCTFETAVAYEHMRKMTASWIWVPGWVGCRGRETKQGMCLRWKHPCLKYIISCKCDLEHHTVVGEGPHFILSY